MTSLFEHLAVGNDITTNAERITDQIPHLAQAENLLLLNRNQTVDVWSFDVLSQKVAALYTVPTDISPLPIPHALSDWQREWLRGEVFKSQLNYWKQQLSGSLPILQLPTDYARPPVQTYSGAYQSLVLPLELTKALKVLSQQEGVSLFETLLAAFQTLLCRYSGQEDIIVGTPIVGNQVETDGLIGSNSLPIRTNLSGNPSFRQLLKQVQKVTIAAYDHQDVPLEQLIEELQLEPLGCSPLFQVMFACLNHTPKESEKTISPRQTHNSTAKFDLTLDLKETPEGIEGRMEYNRDLFDAARIAHTLSHFQTLLEGIVANPEQRIWELPLLTATEQNHLLVKWNQTQSNYPNACIHQLFEAQVERTPDAIAVVKDDEQLTYQQLNHRANQLAHYLQKLGVKPDVTVGICLERSLEMLVVLLAIFKAGGAYIPLDPAYPQDRLAYMLKDLQVSLLLTSEKIAQNLLPASGTSPDTDSNSKQLKVICLNQTWEIINQENLENPKSNVNPTNLAYILYTSGSTGFPKGVANALHLPTLKAASDVTLINTVPSAIAELLRANAIPQGVQTVNLAGEPLSQQLVNQLYQYKTIQQVFNLYGPSETTTYSTYTLCSRNEKAPSIGRPIANTQIYILDSHLQLVATGVPGELHIGGVGLARYYLNRPDLTAQKFILNPFSNDSEARLYKTGDLVRYLPSGNIEYIGRIDHQVKIRGFRIELGEIEAALRQHPAVQTVVVIAREDIPGEKCLVAYLVANQQPVPSFNKIRCFLKQKMPNYMVPAAFVWLDALPLTPNGKIDRRALPAPKQFRQLAETFVAPRNELEIQLIEIWEQVLGIKPISIKDNFFELGGHSLLVVRLAAEIEKTFGKSLPLATLFQAPTVEQLANILQPEKSLMPWSLTEMNPLNGSKPPLFWCGGRFTGLAQLAKHLDARPFYLIQDGYFQIQNPATHIKDWATRALDEIRAVQPEGPYFLGGYCMGGLIAFEIAQQLQAQGQKVALLALVETDSLEPTYRAYQTTFGRLGTIASQFLPLSPQEKLTCVLQLARRVQARIVSKFTRQDANENALSDNIEVAASKLARLAMQNYTPQQAYSGPAAFFFSKISNSAFVFSRLGWGQLITGKLEFSVVPSDHLQQIACL